MASWAKNQITKQLAKFAKNLDPNSLSLKFFKGEGELTNLELDETVLSDLLEFPPWLHLSKVTCNRISTKVPWTSLKSDPIRLILDNVDVQIVASETAREKASNIPIFPQKANTKPTKYGFAEKVLDGIYLSINTLSVSFTSLGFKASVNISRIIVQSTGPDWRPTKNLRHTRVKDDILGEVMIFKEIKWSTMRVDADASYKPESNDAVPSTPLRLITNNSSVRLIIKKRISDCTMIASKLSIILDDILWVLTRSQILKLSSFVHYLLNLRSSYLPLQQQSALSNQDDSGVRSSTPQQSESQNQVFQVYNISETSIHLRTHRIDLHLCDDTTFTGNAAKTTSPNSKLSFDESGAALQISIVNISLDQYPYHIAGTKRPTLNSDDEVAFQRKRWSHQLLSNFQETEGKQWRPTKNPSSLVGVQHGAMPRSYPVMYESYIIMSCRNFQIMQVTTMNIHDPKPVLSSEKDALYLPAEMSAFTIDHTTYYYTGNVDLPVPAPNLFVQVNPIQLRYDPLTCIWINRFAQSVMTGLDWTKEFMSREVGFSEHLNVRVEALMPKVVIPLDNDKSLPHHDERPSSLQVQISQAVLSNCRVGSKCSQTDILNDLQNFIGSRLYADMSVFPNASNDLHPFSNAAWLNDYSINHHQLQNLTKRDPSLYSRLRQDNNLPHQIWCFWCDQIWVEFAGVEKACDRPISFIDAFPLRIWVCSDVPYYEPPAHRPSIGNLSSDSVEVAEVATEFDENVDIKYNKMSVVYDVKIGRVDHDTRDSPDANKQNRLNPSDSSTASAASSPGPRRRSPNTQLSDGTTYRSHGLPSRSDNRCNGVLERDNKTNVDAINNLRTSRSENDLNLGPPAQPLDCRSIQSCVDARVVSNYARGGPPPPYSDDVCDGKNKDNLNASFSSLPPAYEALSDDPGPVTKPVINDFIQYDMDSSDLQRSATVALLMHTSKNVQVQLDHFQLLFLIRLGENISAMMEKIEADNDRANHERKVSLNQLNPSLNETRKDVGVVLNMMIPNIIVDLVLSPCIGIDPIQTYSLVDRVRYEKEKNGSHCDNMPPAVDALDCLPIISSCEVADTDNANASNDMVGEVQSSALKEDIVVGDQVCAELLSEPDGQQPARRGSGTVNPYATSNVPNFYQSPTHSNDISVGASASNESSEIEPPMPSDPLHVLNSDQSISESEIPSRDFCDQTPFINENSAETDSSMEVYQRQALDVNLRSLDGMFRAVNESDGLGCVTVQGNVHDHDLNAFDQTLKEVADIGIQVGNSMMNVNLKPRPEDQLISVLRIRVGCLFLGIEAEGKESLVKVSAETLQLNELGNMKYGKLLDPRGIIGTERLQEKRQINMDSLTGKGVLKLRLGTGSYAEELAEGSSETGFADIRVNSLAAALLMSTIDNLQEFGEDELVSLGMPFVVDITRSDISIYDDKARRYKSAVKLPPSHIIIDELYLMRGKDGVATIKAKPGRDKESPGITESSDEIHPIDSYSATLNGNLIAESINQQVDALIGENSRLLEDLKVVNAKMNGLHSERDSLLKVIDKLQQELVFSNRENDDLHNRIRTLSLSRHQGHYV